MSWVTLHIVTIAQMRMPSLRATQASRPVAPTSASQSAVVLHRGAQNETPSCVVHRADAKVTRLGQHAESLPLHCAKSPSEHMVPMLLPVHLPALQVCPMAHDPHELPQLSTPHTRPAQEHIGVLPPVQVPELQYRPMGQDPHEDP